MKAFLMTAVTSFGLCFAGGPAAHADPYHGGHSHHHHGGDYGGGYGGGYRGGYGGWGGGYGGYRGGPVIIPQPYVVAPSYGCNSYPVYGGPVNGGYPRSGVSIYGNGFGFSYSR